jgi:hypothetical protein
MSCCSSRPNLKPKRKPPAKDDPKEPPSPIALRLAKELKPSPSSSSEAPDSSAGPIRKISVFEKADHPVRPTKSLPATKGRPFAGVQASPLWPSLDGDGAPGRVRLSPGKGLDGEIQLEEVRWGKEDTLPTSSRPADRTGAVAAAARAVEAAGRGELGFTSPEKGGLSPRTLRKIAMTKKFTKLRDDIGTPPTPSPRLGGGPPDVAASEEDDGSGTGLGSPTAAAAAPPASPNALPTLSHAVSSPDNPAGLSRGDSAASAASRTSFSVPDPDRQSRNLSSREVGGLLGEVAAQRARRASELHLQEPGPESEKPESEEPGPESAQLSAFERAAAESRAAEDAAEARRLAVRLASHQLGGYAEPLAARGWTLRRLARSTPVEMERLLAQIIEHNARGEPKRAHERAFERLVEVARLEAAPPAAVPDPTFPELTVDRLVVMSLTGRHEMRQQQDEPAGPAAARSWSAQILGPSEYVVYEVEWATAAPSAHQALQVCWRRYR